VKGGGRHRAADLVLTAEPTTLVELRRGELTVSEARRAGQLRVEGPTTALRNFQRVFRMR